MFWAQVTLIVLTAINLLVAAHRHGGTRRVEDSFPVDFICTLISFALLMCAGAFSKVF